MRRKLLVLGLAAVVGASFLPAGYMFPAASAVSAGQEEVDIGAWEDGKAGENWQCTLEKKTFVVSPAKKTIKVGKSFFIKICPRDVESISYRSSKGSVASVNDNGKVTGKKKGKAIIKTIITLADGSEFIYKTTVYVK